MIRSETLLVPTQLFLRLEWRLLLAIAIAKSTPVVSGVKNTAVFEKLYGHF